MKNTAKYLKALQQRADIINELAKPKPTFTVSAGAYRFVLNKAALDMTGAVVRDKSGSYTKNMMTITPSLDETDHTQMLVVIGNSPKNIEGKTTIRLTANGCGNDKQATDYFQVVKDNYPAMEFDEDVDFYLEVVAKDEEHIIAKITPMGIVKSEFEAVKDEDVKDLFDKAVEFADKANSKVEASITKRDSRAPIYDRVEEALG